MPLRKVGKWGKAKAGLVGWGGWGGWGGAWLDLMIYGLRNRAGQPLPPPSFDALPLDHDIILPFIPLGGGGVGGAPLVDIVTNPGH